MAGKVLNADKAEQTKLMEEFLNGLHTDDHMKNYYKNSTGRLFKIDGSMVRIEKPRIETSFCFGYGQNGVSTEEDSDRASRCAQHVKNDKGTYFKEKNLRGLNEMLSNLADSEMTIVMYKCGDMGYSEVYSRRYYEKIQDNETVISDDDRKECIKQFKRVKEDFEKRLDTYLKRYGTSKLRTWSYLVD